MMRPTAFVRSSIRAKPCQRNVTNKLRPTDARLVHSSKARHAVAASPHAEVPLQESVIQLDSRPVESHRRSPLSILSTTSVLRTYLITSMSSSPRLIGACFALLRRMLDSQSVLMNPDRNPVLRWIFKKTFYAQFCAGENVSEVGKTAREVKRMGYEGMVLEYALEVLEGDVPKDAQETIKEIEIFRKGMKETIEMASPGDFVALKWSGLGREALHLLKTNRPPTPAMQSCINELCDVAKAKGVLFLPGAEEEFNGVNTGLETWILALQRKYNRDRPFMYYTYQTYLKETPPRLVRHLALAKEEGFMPAIKLVRGAYLKSEPKELVFSSFEETSECYDGLVKALLTRRWNSALPSQSRNQQFPERIGLMLATHNIDSIRKAQSIRDEQIRGKASELNNIELSYAQLQGMADEISCELVEASKTTPGAGVAKTDKPRPFKAATWGSIQECLNFLVRRASENQDALGRTMETRVAMGKELKRRFWSGIGLR